MLILFYVKFHQPGLSELNYAIDIFFETENSIEKIAFSLKDDELNDIELSANSPVCFSIRFRVIDRY